MNKRNIYRKDIREILIKFIKNTELRWKSCTRNKTRFQLKNKLWLESSILFPENENQVHNPELSNVGRPTKIFEDCGIRPNKRRFEI